tara:strand:+ start:90 stop:290 length:201 start_codon:yes stop_codon:yes gene_type:complete
MSEEFWGLVEWIIILSVLYFGYRLYDYFNQYTLKIEKERKEKQEANYWSLSSLLRNSPVIMVVPDE